MVVHSISSSGNSRAAFVLVSSIVIMHRYILKLTKRYLDRLAIDHTHN